VTDFILDITPDTNRLQPLEENAEQAPYEDLARQGDEIARTIKEAIIHSLAPEMLKAWDARKKERQALAKERARGPRWLCRKGARCSACRRLGGISLTGSCPSCGHHNNADDAIVSG
jgi:hypothetical protein